MTKTALAPTASREEAWDHIKRKLDECRDGISDAEAECLGLAETWDFDEEKIVESFRKAREVREAELKKRPLSSDKQRFNASMLRLAQSQSARARAPAMATGAGPTRTIPTQTTASFA